MINPEQVLKFVSKNTGVSEKNIFSKSRFSEFVAARKELIKILHHNGMSASAIGRYMGYADHTSIIHHLKFQGRRAPRIGDTNQ